MSGLPEIIRKVSLPSVVFCTLFLWSGVVYLGFARILPLAREERLRYLLFGLTSIGLSLVSYATFRLYSSVALADSLFWCRLQMAATLPVFITFVLFTSLTLKLHRGYFFRILPVVTLLFMPFVYMKGGFFQEAASITTFAFASHTTRIIEAEPGPVFYLFLAWVLPNLIYLAYAWIQHYRRHLEGAALPLGFSIFVLCLFNDMMVVTKVYSFFYLAELGFSVFILSMGVQLFKHYVVGMHRLDAKTKEVAALNEEMQFLVGTMSHDLKAPLISIRGFAELLEEDIASESPKSRSFLGRIQANADQMLGLIEDLLNYIKVGWVLEDRGPVDLKKVLEEVLLQLAGSDPSLPGRLEAPASWPALNSSAKGLRHILLNLLQNAAKFCPRGKIQLTYSKKPDGLELAVSDGGPGVTKELREQIFDPFFRSQREVPGSGMGLAIVKKTAERLGGRVWLDEEYKRGACFRVFLPDAA
jgi:signal transduction histidine kinase